MCCGESLPYCPSVRQGQFGAGGGGGETAPLFPVFPRLFSFARFSQIKFTGVGG